MEGKEEKGCDCIVGYQSTSTRTHN